MQTKTLHNVALFWSLFIGIGAFLGAAMMFYDTTGQAFGMAPMLPSFQVLPFADVLFQDFLFPAIALLIVNGLSNAIATLLLIKKNRLAPYASLVCGLLLMGWIIIQFVIFEWNFLSIAYFVFGDMQAVTAWLLIKKIKSDEEA